MGYTRMEKDDKVEMIRKVVIPAEGLETRLFPTTKKQCLAFGLFDLCQ
jgi:hypothetical protein